MALLLLAGLQTVPGSLTEAARMDGAKALQTFWFVRLPLLVPTLLIAGMFRALDAFRVFDLVYVLTGGGPANSTETLSTLSYKILFSTLQFGYGSALSTAMFLDRDADRARLRRLHRPPAQEAVMVSRNRWRPILIYLGAAMILRLVGGAVRLAVLDLVPERPGADRGRTGVLAGASHARALRQRLLRQEIPALRPELDHRRRAHHDALPGRRLARRLCALAPRRQGPLRRPGRHPLGVDVPADRRSSGRST